MFPWLLFSNELIFVLKAPANDHWQSGKLTLCDATLVSFSMSQNTLYTFTTTEAPAAYFLICWGREMAARSFTLPGHVKCRQPSQRRLVLSVGAYIGTTFSESSGIKFRRATVETNVSSICMYIMHAPQDPDEFLTCAIQDKKVRSATKMSVPVCAMCAKRDCYYDKIHFFFHCYRFRF